jgi:hypothetical protein
MTIEQIVSEINKLGYVVGGCQMDNDPDGSKPYGRHWDMHATLEYPPKCEKCCSEKRKTVYACGKTMQEALENLLVAIKQ